MNFYMLYRLKICPLFKYFQESPLAVQVLVNNKERDLMSLALCKCLPLITVANTATWLKKNICFEGTNAGLSRMTLLRVPWHTNRSHTTVPYAAERPQCKTRHIAVGQVRTWKENSSWGTEGDLAPGIGPEYTDGLFQKHWAVWVISPQHTPLRTKNSWWQFNTNIP